MNQNDGIFLGRVDPEGEGLQAPMKFVGGGDADLAEASQPLSSASSVGGRVATTPAHSVSVAADEFRGAVDRESGAVGDGALEDGGGERRVDGHRHVACLIDHVETWIVFEYTPTWELPDVEGNE